MLYKNDRKYQICHHKIRISSSKCTKIRFRPAPDPAGGAYDAPPGPLVSWGEGYPLPIPLPARRLRRLGSQAPPQHKILAVHASGPLIVTFALSSTVSEIIAGFVRPESFFHTPLLFRLKFGCDPSGVG